LKAGCTPAGAHVTLQDASWRQQQRTRRRLKTHWHDRSSLISCAKAGGAQLRIVQRMIFLSLTCRIRKLHSMSSLD
jgi:hypothetical protein